MTVAILLSIAVASFIAAVCSTEAKATYTQKEVATDGFLTVSLVLMIVALVFAWIG